MDTFLSIISFGAYPGASVAEYITVAVWIFAVTSMTIHSWKDEPVAAIVLLPFYGVLFFFPAFILWGVLDGIL